MDFVPPGSNFFVKSYIRFHIRDPLTSPCHPSGCFVLRIPPHVCRHWESCPRFTSVCLPDEGEDHGFKDTSPNQLAERLWSNPMENSSAAPQKIKYSFQKGEVAQSCPTLCDPMDCSPPGSSIHGLLQARILERPAVSFSSGSSWPRDRTRVSCIASRLFTSWANKESRIP